MNNTGTAMILFNAVNANTNQVVPENHAVVNLTAYSSRLKLRDNPCKKEKIRNIAAQKYDDLSLGESY